MLELTPDDLRTTAELRRCTLHARAVTPARSAHTVSSRRQCMNARQGRSMARLVRADRHFGIRVPLENPPPMYEHFVGKLKTEVAHLRELEYEQHTLTPQHAVEGKKTAYLRKRLRREYMVPLTRVGRRVLRYARGIEQALKVPHARVSHRELVTAAEVMLKTVQPHRALLLSAGFPKTFFTEFRELTKELKRIATTSSQRQAKFARVSEELRRELASANDTLRILDGLMFARTDHDYEFAKIWKDILRTPKRLGRPPAKKRKVTPNGRSAQGSREDTLTT